MSIQSYINALGSIFENISTYKPNESATPLGLLAHSALERIEDCETQELIKEYIFVCVLNNKKSMYDDIYIRLNNIDKNKITNKNSIIKILR